MIHFLCCTFIISCIRLDVALDYEIDITDKYSGGYFLEEIKGLADATGLDYKVHFFLFCTHVYTFVIMHNYYFRKFKGSTCLENWRKIFVWSRKLYIFCLSLVKDNVPCLVPTRLLQRLEDYCNWGPLTGTLMVCILISWKYNISFTYAGPFKNYPQVTVYHPSKGNGHDFANVGWTGWIGSITGKIFNLWM